MKAEITKNKLLSISLIAVLGASFLTSCNNKKSDSKDQNQQTSSPGGNGPGGNGPGGNGPGTNPNNGNDSIAGNLVDNDLNKNDDEVFDLSLLPHASSTLSAEFKALKLEDRAGLTLKLKSLCGDDNKNKSVFNNGHHKTPIAFELVDNAGPVVLTPEQLLTVRNTLIIKDIENHKDISLTSAEKTFDEFTRCANGEVPADAQLNNVIYIKPQSSSFTKLRLIGSLELKEGETTIYSVPKTSKFKDALKIPVVENAQKGKTDLFDSFKHKFKVDNNKTKEKYKYMITKYVGKDKNNENVTFTVNDIQVTDADGLSINVAPGEAKLTKNIPNIGMLKIGNNKTLTGLEFFGMDAQVTDIQALFKSTFAGSDFKFHDAKDLAAANKLIQTEKALGLLIRINDSVGSTSHSKIKVTVTGTDSFGNEFTSDIKDDKW